jgi:hypothetical protein
MKRFILFFVVVLFGSAAFAQGPTVTVVNNTGYTISYLYVSSNTTEQWEEDVLGRKVLSNGSSFRLTLPGNGTYDFKAKDSDGDEYIKWNVVVRGNTTVTLTIADFQVASSNQTSSSTSVNVVNDTGYTIFYLYVSSDDSTSWEEDVLDDDVLSTGEEVRVTLPNSGIWDFKAIDKDGDEYFKHNIVINRGSSNRVVFRLSDMD